MFPPSSPASRLAGSRGFTLLELLVVIVVLAALGGAAIVAAGNTRDNALQQVAQMEMQKIKQALLQFRQDTGYFPGQGPFALVAIGTVENPDGTCTPAPIGGGAMRRGGNLDAWHNSPANFSQLYSPPELCTNHPQAALVRPTFLPPGTLKYEGNWDQATGRGWRGPYLSALGEGLVDIGDNLLSTGAGSPVSGSTLANLLGVADPFVASPASAGGYAICEEEADNDPNNCLLDWRTVAYTETVEGTETHARWGRPYLLFELGDAARARLVSMGPDGRYAGPNTIAYCAAPTDSDDLVLCLLR